jgi:hypothetical protein
LFLRRSISVTAILLADIKLAAIFIAVKPMASKTAKASE